MCTFLSDPGQAASPCDRRRSTGGRSAPLDRMIPRVGARSPPGAIFAGLASCTARSNGTGVNRRHAVDGHGGVPDRNRLASIGCNESLKKRPLFISPARAGSPPRTRGEARRWRAGI